MFCTKKYVLDNGLQVFIKKIPNKKTISCGVWVNQGSKDEDCKTNGLSHIVEHLMFKIDSKESSLSMKKNMNKLKNSGAYYNATTRKDHTSFYIEGLSNDSENILESLSYFVVNKDKYKFGNILPLSN